MSEKKTVEEFIAEQRDSIQGNSECGMSHYNLATGLLNLRQLEEAEKEFKEAVRCSPTLAEAYVQLGGICLQRGDLDGCLQYSQASINARPRFAEGYGNIGFVEFQKGNIDKAIVALEKAVKDNQPRGKGAAAIRSLNQQLTAEGLCITDPDITYLAREKN